MLPPFLPSLPRDLRLSLEVFVHAGFLPAGGGRKNIAEESLGYAVRKGKREGRRERGKEGGREGRRGIVRQASLALPAPLLKPLGSDALPPSLPPKADVAPHLSSRRAGRDVGHRGRSRLGVEDFGGGSEGGTRRREAGEVRREGLREGAKGSIEPRGE